MSLENHPQLCNMSETLGRVGPDRNERIDRLSRRAGRALADIEQTGDPAALIRAAESVWETAAAWSKDADDHFRNQIAEGQQQCGGPENGSAEQKAVAAGQSALRGISLLYRMIADQMTEEADRAGRTQR